uniref:Uncharacterized protein n=1 Tax=Rhizophora mucronata TaxID=61149 RepID=A0A2P2L732_RHIMU
MNEETTKPSVGMTGGDQYDQTGPSGSGYSSLIWRPLPVGTVLLLGAVFSYLLLFKSAYPFQFWPETSQVGCTSLIQCSVNGLFC